MIAVMSQPTPLMQHGKYWSTSWYDDSGKRREKRFGAVDRVTRATAGQRWSKFMAEWDAKPHVKNPDLERRTVGRLVAAYKAHAEEYYRRPDGTPTKEHVGINYAVTPLAEAYPELPAEDLTPQHLQAVQAAMVESGLARNTVNQRINKIKRMARWAAANGWVTGNTLYALNAVEALAAGRTAAKESPGVKPVPQAHIDAALDKCLPAVGAMIRLQLLTGMRPGEVILMRGAEIQTSGDVWTYRPAQHKTAHHGKTREILLGPKCQAILKPWFGMDTTAYLFRPQRNRVGQGEHYTSNSYLLAIYRACDQANVNRWSPGQLRHNAATAFSHGQDLETSSILLGHSKVETTQIYAERNRARAIAVAKEIA